MFLGASPGSTGGGIKTTTTFVLMKSMFSAATNRHCSAFKRRIPTEVVSQAFLIAILALAVVCVQTFLMCIAEPELDFMKLLFETVSAFGTVGLSTGITPDLNAGAKLILITTMFIGRLGGFFYRLLPGSRRNSRDIAKRRNDSGRRAFRMFPLCGK